MNERALTSYLTIFPEARAELGLPPIDPTVLNIPYAYDRLPGSSAWSPVILSSDLDLLVLPDHTPVISDLPGGTCSTDARDWFDEMKQQILDTTGILVDHARPIAGNDHTVPFDICNRETDGRRLEDLDATTREYVLHYVFVASQYEPVILSVEADSRSLVELDDPRAKNLYRIVAKLRQLEIVDVSVRFPE